MQNLEYDYVVVGGGTAGCVIAARLAAETSQSIALIERGRTDSNRWIHIPATFFKVLQSKDANIVVSEPDATLDDKRFPVPQGRVVGGGSSVNGMIYMRGQQQDYDDWALLHGCDGWSFNDVLPTFKRQENNTRLRNRFHGTDGKLVVADPQSKHPVSAAIVEAAVKAGIAYTDDFNGVSQEGAGWYQVTAHNGQRQSAAHCFLTPELARENLQLLTGYESRKICIERDRAVAVEAVDVKGDSFRLAARQEIIITAGSFHSPKLLMLSGVGPAKQLKQHGIEVKFHSPEVGSNYQDHIGTPVTRRLVNIKGLYGADRGFKALKHGFDYFVRKKGLLNSNLLSAGACVDTSGGGRPDVQYNFAPFAPGAPGQPPLEFHAVQIHPMTMRPRSRGKLSLRSSNPDEALFFQANVLDTETDMDTLRRGIRLAEKIFDQSPLKEIIGEAVWPDPSVSTAVGSNSLDQAIRSHARTIFHPAGTCRMGSDPDSVVDTQLRVRGIENLRVADCSVMPALVSGNTNAPTMMIADRCVDFILANTEQ